MGRWMDGRWIGWVDGSGTTIILTLQNGKLRHRAVKRWPGERANGCHKAGSTAALSARPPLLNNPRDTVNLPITG